MRTEFIEQYDVSRLTPADYNPRKLEEDKFEKLQSSLRKFGIIKPLIINGDNGVLTAGHQRTRAMKAVGITHAPVIRISGIKIQDEIKFNLFHNSIETNKTPVRIKRDKIDVGYCIIKPDEIFFESNKNATIVKEISKLILKYGEWGSIVATESGEVILNSDYAVASKGLRCEMICCIIKNEWAEELKELLSIDYGSYNYESLGIKSYNQLYCQMNRLTSNAKRENKSSTYENFVIPNIKKDMRILDFGAGKCAYANTLKANGFHILPYEPNYQNANNNIDIKMVVSQIRAIARDVKEHGLFDVVVLDSVLNSVVSKEVEDMVITVCASFLKPTGTFYTGTRNLLNITRKAEAKRNNEPARSIEFLDKDNFSATFRSGVWTMQHFHSEETLGTLLGRFYEEVNTYNLGFAKANIYAIAKRPRTIPLDILENALEFELNMEYPNGYRHNKHEELKQLILEAHK